MWVVGPLLLILGLLGWFIAPTFQEACLNSAFVVTFSALGWVGGMILSPDSDVEEKKFTGLWKGISLFASGYLLSKIDPLIAALLKPEAILGMDNTHMYRLVACLGSAILTAILTYVLRIYAFTMGAAKPPDEI